MLEEFNEYIGLYEAAYNLDDGLLTLEEAHLDIVKDCPFTVDEVNGFVTNLIVENFKVKNMISILKGKISILYVSDFWIVVFVGSYKDKEIALRNKNDDSGYLGNCLNDLRGRLLLEVA